MIKLEPLNPNQGNQRGMTAFRIKTKKKIKTKKQKTKPKINQVWEYELN